MKTVIIIILSVSMLAGGTWFYYHEYEETLMLSEIIEDTGNPYLNLLIGVMDFKTELTRHDLKEISKSKDYWLNRIDQINAINDPEIANSEMAKLIDEMMKDPHMKKLVVMITELGIESAVSVLGILD